MVNLNKGEVVNLSKESSGDLNEIMIGLGWQGLNGRSLDLDSYIALQDSKGKNLEFIFFGNKNCKGVKHYGDDLTGGGSTNDINEKIRVTINKLDSKVERIVAGLFIYSGASNLSQVDHAFTHILDNNGNKLASFNIKDKFGKDKSITVGEFRKSNGEWKFKAIGKGSSDGFRKIKDKYTSNNSSLLGRIFG